MKILIAEDQAISRELMVKMLESLGQIEAFATGQEALKAFENASISSEPFQIMISDISMPGMSGIELLKAVRAFESRKKISKQNKIKVIMFTSYANKETVIECYMGGCDDYVLKPFNRSVIIEKISKLGFQLDIDNAPQAEKSMGQMVSDAIEGFKNGKVELPALPNIVQELQNLINRPNTSASDMAKLIENDTAMSIKLIVAANSPFYGGVEKAKDVKMAINRLGIHTTHSIVSSIANKGLYNTKNISIKNLMDKVWMHSFATAHCAREIGKKVSSVGYEKAYVKGLIHDVGATLLIKNIGDNINETSHLDLDGLTGAVFEVHTSFGGTLLNKWGFSKDFVDVASLHEWDKFDKKTEQEVLIVNLADRLSYTIGYGFFNKDVPELSDIQSADLLGLTESELTVICDKAAKAIAESADAFTKK
ncbi:MAG: HDOD domain-containing protein [Desulfamplus sp.]|nr:HDOD domain-containing protein [Desulfamplus sp.]